MKKIFNNVYTKNKYLLGVILIMAAIILMTAVCSKESEPPAEVQAGENPFFSDYKTAFNVPPFDLIKNEHFVPAFEEGMKLRVLRIPL